MKSLFKKVSLASDHAGFNLKERIKKFLVKKKIKVIDLGPKNNNSVDYPDYAKKVARNVSSKIGFSEEMFLPESGFRKKCFFRNRVFGRNVSSET